MKRVIYCSLGMWTAVACGDDPEQPPPHQEQVSAVPRCSADADAPLFDTLPVAADAIGEVIVFGELDPGGDDVIPNHQSGIRLTGEGIALVAPGAGFIVGVRASTFVASPFREGETDYGLLFRPCAEATATFLHVASLAPDLAALLDEATCTTYSTDVETVDDCNRHGLEVEVAAGQTLGTVGGATSGGFDFDMVDERSTAHVTARGGAEYAHAVCFSRFFTAGPRALLEARTGLLGEVRTGDPACGTLEVDVPGTAQGVWIQAARAAADPPDADALLTLAPDFLDPEGAQDIAVGGAEHLVRVVRSTTGRTNRDFGGVVEDGLVYCYGDVDSARSFLVRLAPGATLTLERVEHAPGDSPCDDGPDTWSFTAAAVDYVR